MNLIAFLIIGAIAGWLAGKVMSGHGYGIVWDVVLGILGAFVGGFIVSAVLGIEASGLIASFIVALLGACILVAIVHLIKGERIRTT